MWVVRIGDRGLIVSSNSVRRYIGEYSSEDRAKEVLFEIFDYYRNGKNSYIVPKE